MGRKFIAMQAAHLGEQHFTVETTQRPEGLDTFTELAVIIILQHLPQSRTTGMTIL